MPVFRLLLSLLVALSVMYTYYKDPKIEFLPSLLRQTSPLPTPEKPSTWIPSQQGDTKVFGSVTVVVPAGFTQQSGATVLGDTVSVLTTAGKAPGIIPGTEFALGIWPDRDQTLFLQSFELKFVLDAAKLQPGEVGSFTIKMYRPEDESWVELPSTFEGSRYALVVLVKEIAPVPKDFELGWGWRTFFGIFKKTTQTPGNSTSTTTTTTTTTTTGNLTPKANRNANLRSGPGTNYSIIGSVRQGEPLDLVGKTVIGDWFLLSNNRWISAVLVSDAPNLPIVRSTPTAPAARIATSTPTPNANNLISTAIAATLTARAPTPRSTPTPNVNSIVSTAIAATLTARAPTPTPDVQSIIATAVAATLTAEAPKPKP